MRDKGWRLTDVRRTFADSLVGMLLLGGITCVIMLTAAATLQGKTVASIADVAQGLEALFGSWSVIVLTIGIIAGALSSFLVNAMIGGRLLADGFGKGETTESPWSRHGTAIALIAGLAGGLFAHLNAEAAASASISPIIIAQASTILGGPALAATLLYLALRPEIRSAPDKRAPGWMIGLAAAGFAVTLILAWRTGIKLFG